MTRLVVMLMFFCCGTASAAPTGKSKQKKNLPTKKSDPKPDQTKPESSPGLRFAIAGGLQNVYLPSLSVEGLVARGNFQLGGELGFFRLSQSVFNGSTNFIGITGRWRMSSSKPYFLGASFGSRSVSLTTSADLSYSDATTGSTSVTTIAWTRKVSQTVLYPRAGLMWTTERSALIAGVGLMMPLSSKASISGDPPSATGISDEDYQTTADQKLQDVTKTTNAMLPGLEFKYLLYFN